MIESRKGFLQRLFRRLQPHTVAEWAPAFYPIGATAAKRAT